MREVEKKGCERGEEGSGEGTQGKVREGGGSVCVHMYSLLSPVITHCPVSCQLSPSPFFSTD